MTPGARVAAAIEILDDMASGQAAEQALTRWARRSRFAGSKDRAAVRDHVFDAMRCRSSAAHFGQGSTGRAIMTGLLHQQGADLSTLFDGVGHAAAPLTPEEEAFPPASDMPAIDWNLPDWLVPHFQTSLGADAASTAHALQSRAPVHLRTNLRKTSLEGVRANLAAESIVTKENPLSSGALTVTEGARRVRLSSCYRDGLVELQDGASQAVVDALPKGGIVLDFCAGGGGKALALAADKSRRVLAHDIDPKRMTDLAPRAARAGVEIEQISTENLSKAAPYDVVLCDAPCSGAGAWRRAPEGKWLLTQSRLDALTQMQDSILDDAARVLKPGGTLAYATCSVLACENEDRITAFLGRHPGWGCVLEQRFEVTEHGDGFFTAHLTQE